MPERVQRLSTPWVIFGAAAVVSLAVILIGSRDTVFSGDELGILYRLADQPLSHALFEPPAEKYLIAAPTLIYGGIAEIFGAGSYLPYRILGAALVVLAAGLFLALARRRAPLALALPCSILLLFFGAAAEVVAIPGRVPGQVAICAGLGLLLALDRGDRRGNAAACALGTLAVVSHPIGLAFVAAALIIVVIGRPAGWRSAWVGIVPLAVYGLWWLTLREAVDNGAPLSLGDAFAFGRDAFVAVCAALTGIFHAPWTDDGDFITDASRAIALLSVLAAVIAIARARRFSIGLLAALAALGVALIGPVLAPGGTAFGLRAPDSARYLYPGAVLVLLVLVELVALTRPAQPRRAHGPASSRVGGRRGLILPVAGAAVFVIALASNLAQLTESAADYRDASSLVRAQFGAFDFAREGRSPRERAAEQGQSVEQSSAWLSLMLGFSNPEGVDRVALGAPAYYAIKDRYGLPADDAAALTALPAPLADQADRVLVAALPLGLPPTGPGSASCRGGRRLAGAQASVPVASQGGRMLVLAPDGTSPTVSVGRFSGRAVQPLVWPEGQRSAALSLPAVPPASPAWQVLAQGAVSIRYCPTASGASG